jgi:hypothetical protein
VAEVDAAHGRAWGNQCGALSQAVFCSTSRQRMRAAAAAAAWLLIVSLAWHLGPVSGQRSVPVSNTNQFAIALQDQTVWEIILDPTGTGV